MRRTDAPKKYSYHTYRTWREVLAQNADIIDLRMEALEDCDAEDVDNVKEEISIEDEEMELYRERAQSDVMTCVMPKRLPLVKSNVSV